MEIEGSENVEQLLSIIFSAIIAGIVSYWFNLKQSKKNIKIDLQIKASQSMLEEINRFRNSVSEVYYSLSSLVFFVQQYDRITNKDIMLNTRVVDSSDRLHEVFSQESLLKSQIDLINDAFIKHTEKWELFSTSFYSFWTTYESNQTILNEFDNIYDFLLKEFDLFVDCRNKIISEYQMKINPDIISKKDINDLVLQEIEKTFKILEKSKFDFESYLGDFIKELQNKYLSKLFDDYKIPIRNPRNDKHKVISLDDKRERYNGE